MDQPIDVTELQHLVKQRRQRLGMSLRAAAEDASVPFSTLARVEKGQLPDLANFQRLVIWLGVSPERFFAPKVRTEATPDVIAHHLMTDPFLSDSAAERIAALVRELYESLAQPPETIQVHLRAATTFKPAASSALGEMLGDMVAELNRRGPAGNE